MKTRLSTTIFGLLAASMASAFGAMPYVGTYNGLFYETNGVWQQSAGSLTLTVTRNARYSGRLQLGNARYSFSGYFDSTGAINRQVVRHWDVPLLLQFQVDSSDSDLITGTVGDGNWTAPVYADRAVFTPSYTTSDMGRYTVVFLGDITATNSPGGESFGTINITKSGRLQFTGTLADGTKVSQSTAISKYGDWPLYLPLYHSEGALYSWLLVNGSAPATNYDITGSVTWIRPQMSWTWYYPDGFAVVQNAAGCRYVAPPRGTKILDTTYARFEFNGVNLGLGFTNHVMLDNRNRITNLEANRLNGTFRLSDGYFSGRVMDPITWGWIPFKGVVLQKFAVAGGYFPLGDQTGEVWFQWE